MAAPTIDLNSTRIIQNRKFIKIKGAKASIYNAQLLVSSGVPSFDNIIGGGIAVGTVVLIDSDVFTSYSDVLLKCYLAEGAVVRNGLFVATTNNAEENLLKKLPVPFKEVEGLPPKGHEDGPLKIAWQYEKVPAIKSLSKAPVFGHHYDLSQTMKNEDLNYSKIETFSLTNCSPQNGSFYDQLLTSIKKHIDENRYGTESPPDEKSTILRVALQSVGSPLWESSEDLEASTKVAFCRFLYRLRGLMRSSLATCMITVPTHLFEERFSCQRIERLSDTVVRLESFADSDKEMNPIYKDYQGLFHVMKIPTLNSLITFQPGSYDFGFKLRRKKFVIETLHLPPEISRTPTKRQDKSDLKSRATASCSQAMKGSNLDF